MSVSVEKLEKSMVRLTIEVSAEDFDKAINRVYNRQKNRMNVPGFRRGKTPRKVLEKMYGAAIFYEDAANDVINSSYPDAAKESGEDIVSNPEINVTQIEAGKPFIYTAEVAVRPPVSLGKYKGVEVDKQDITVSEEEIDADIRREQEKNAVKNEITDRPVQDGDDIELDFEGFKDGVAFEGGRGLNYPLTIGSGSFIPGFEEQLIGANIGEELEVHVTFPEEYQSEELAGQPAVFKCTVKKIIEKILPELDDEFADEVSEFSTMAEYREDVRKKITERKERAAQTAKENQAVEKVIADSHVDIPEAMLKTQQEEMIRELEQQLMSQGISMDGYMQYLQTNREAMLENMKSDAEQRILYRLVVEAVAKAENIEATEEDYEARLQEMAEIYRRDIENIRTMFADRKDSLMEDLAVQKAITFIADNAVEVEKKEEPAQDKAE
ncbi:MAG: trigger factor [Eubacteriales bacterium]|nr:trigger factor [Sarcina sp.]MBR2729673.1 trigger factor [Lachnospiraceae bacterium]MDO4417751.1 trigger factor [Eubacteriales bacterium]